MSDGLSEAFRGTYFNNREEKENKFPDKFKVITLCGSTKFKDKFFEIQKKLTLQGYIVISVGLFGHSGDEEALDEETKTMLDIMHKRKINMSDEIFVIDVDNYIGSSTKSEIEYATTCDKIIHYLSSYKFKNASTEIDNDDSFCPECGSKLKEKWSGVECTKCDYMFCY